jgi:tetratricopeptide (TPR) repeat protein
MKRRLGHLAGRNARANARSWPVLVLLAVVDTSTAYAKGSGPAEQRLVDEARKACLTGDYQKGIAILSDLFVKTEAANYIYNQGRCLEQNARYEQAILRFEEYLRVTKGSDAKERADADEHIAECQAKLAKSTTAAPPPATSPPVAVQQPVSIEPKPVTTVEHPQSGSSTPGRGLRIAGITAGALGVASLATAVILNIKANNMADDLNTPAGYDRGKLSTRSNYQTGSWVGYGVGSACLVGGAILYYLGYSAQSSNAVALLPLVSPEQAGVLFRRGF